jgi:hypothetical protein
MADLLLENVPEDLLLRLEKMAQEESLPLQEETIRLLRQAVDKEQASTTQVNREKVRTILDQIRRNPIIAASGTPDSVELLREDRNR